MLTQYLVVKKRVIYEQLIAITITHNILLFRSMFFTKKIILLILQNCIRKLYKNKKLLALRARIGIVQNTIEITLQISWYSSTK